jgi:hypothetical protein
MKANGKHPMIGQVAKQTTYADDSGYIANPNGGKPKGMHWKTYYRLTAEHDDYVNQALLGISVKLGIMTDRLSALPLK